MSAYDRAACATIASQLFFDGKIKEFEAACFGQDKARIQAAEENCRSALTALLDAMRAQTLQIIDDMRRR